MAASLIEEKSGALPVYETFRLGCGAMINDEVGLHTVDAVPGHKDQRSTARYSHLSCASLMAAVRK